MVALHKVTLMTRATRSVGVVASFAKVSGEVREADLHVLPRPELASAPPPVYACIRAIRAIRAK